MGLRAGLGARLGWRSEPPARLPNLYLNLALNLIPNPNLHLNPSLLYPSISAQPKQEGECRISAFAFIANLRSTLLVYSASTEIRAAPAATSSFCGCAPFPFSVRARACSLSTGLRAGRPLPLE